MFWRSARRGLVKFCPNPLISIPRAPTSAFRIFRCSLFEEVCVLDPIEDLNQPRKRVRSDLVVAALRCLEIAESRRQMQLGESPIGDVTDVSVNVGRTHAFNSTEAESKVDKTFF